MKNTFLGILILALTTFASQSFAFDIDNSRDIYLIRHAEKQSDGTKNPSLTKEGVKRAENIAQMLIDKNISAIYSSNYKRTKETAIPLAIKLNIEVAIYDPRKLKEFSKELLKTQGNILVVGHSNTTPNLAIFLGGDSYGKIDESEYNRVYHLKINSQGVQSQLLSSNNN